MLKLQKKVVKGYSLFSIFSLENSMMDQNLFNFYYQFCFFFSLYFRFLMWLKGSEFMRTRLFLKKYERWHQMLRWGSNMRAVESRRAWKNLDHRLVNIRTGRNCKKKKKERKRIVEFSPFTKETEFHSPVSQNKFATSPISHFVIFSSASFTNFLSFLFFFF